MPSSNKLRQWFWLLFVLNAVFIIVSRYLLDTLNSGVIIEFEIAGTVAKANAILARWDVIPGFRNLVLLSIYIDYIFIVLYTLLLIVACRFFAVKSKQDVLSRASRFFAVLIAAAAICDVIENFAMTYTLTQAVERWSVRLAYDMAVAKFSVLIVTVLFLMVCLIFSIPLSKRKYRPFRE